ncbi:hypothetical protein [Yinghuangia seranimata]|uniref:hypothetical protein n=1 Tax=Yinghuangia seranimata TaxID=408067 RepID=UPI00248B205F|nr:hypothetical protein [Yinghuangia seranimata]MDI2127356.1 hypothetical protein [Yinghuangia seranimata]
MDTGQTRRAAVAGTLTAFLLVAGLGNQWLYDKLLDHYDSGKNSGWQLVARISFPHWIVDKSDKFENVQGKVMAGMLVGAILLVVAVGVVIAIAARRPGFNTFISGWFALVIGGAVYGVTYLTIAGDSLTRYDESQRSLMQYLNVVTEGAGYGLVTGWAVGLVCVMAVSSGYAAASLPSASAPPPPSMPPSAGGYRY